MRRRPADPRSVRLLLWTRNGGATLIRHSVMPRSRDEVATEECWPKVACGVQRPNANSPRGKSRRSRPLARSTTAARTRTTEPSRATAHELARPMRVSSRARAKAREISRNTDITEHGYEAQTSQGTRRFVGESHYWLQNDEGPVHWLAGRRLGSRTGHSRCWRPPHRHRVGRRSIAEIFHLAVARPIVNRSDHMGDQSDATPTL